MSLLTSDWSEEARVQLYGGTTPASLGEWPGKLRGEWIWRSAVHRLNRDLASAGNIQDNDVKVLDAAGEDALLAARNDLRQAADLGFAAADTSLPRHVRTALTALRETADALAKDKENAEKCRRAVELVTFRSDILPGEPAEWNRLAVQLDIHRGALKEQDSAPDAGSGSRRETGSESEKLWRQAIEYYQRSVITSELQGEANSQSRETRAYALANWAANLRNVPEAGSRSIDRLEHQRVAFDLAREAAALAPEEDYIWLRVAECAFTTADRVYAAEKRVELLQRDQSKRQDFLEAKQALGTAYRQVGFVDKAIETFAQLAVDRADDPVYALVEVGELLRWARYPVEEALEAFHKAAALDEKKPLDKRDQWGQWRLGIAYEQNGQIAEAEAAYLRSCRISDKRGETEPDALRSLTQLYLKLDRWPKAAEAAAELQARKMWRALAAVAEQVLLSSNGERIAAAQQWLAAIVQATEEEPLEHWAARAKALYLQNREEDAFALIAHHIDKTPQEQRNEAFAREVHFTRAELLAHSEKERAIWQLALAPADRWDENDDPARSESLSHNLRGLPAYDQLRTALLTPADRPERFVTLAEFHLAAAEAARKTGEEVEQNRATAAAAACLKEAIGLGAAVEQFQNPPLNAIAGRREWSDEVVLGANTAYERLADEATALAKALTIASTEPSWTRAGTREKQWPLLRARLVGHYGLKRRGGSDFYGQPYLWNAQTGKVNVSPQTQGLVGKWLHVAPDGWTFPAKSDDS
jgi:tetratricopeptide (TPR) repeat protein